MDGVMHQRTLREGAPREDRLAALFAEDFDDEQPALDPDVVEPSYSAAELANTREAAWCNGHTAGLQEAAADHAAALRLALQNIAVQLAQECQEAASRAEQSVEAAARLLLKSLDAAFPALCSRYGDPEVHAIVRAVLPTLTQEAAIGLRAHPRTAAALGPELANLEPDLAARLQVIECDAMPPGDVRIAWQNGTTERDAAALWQQVTDILALADLLDADMAIRETVDGD
jgi:flagellar biosynthesis/type III secretory pathway protein FliH